MKLIYKCIIGAAIVGLLWLGGRWFAPDRAPVVVPSPPMAEESIPVSLSQRPVARPPAERLDGPDVQAVMRQLFGQSASGKYSGWSAAELIDALGSEGLDAKERQRMLWALCRLDDPEARAFLHAFVNDDGADEYLRATVLDGLSAADQRWAYDLTVSALGSESAVVARAAIRALGNYGGDSATAILSELAFDFEADPAIALVAAEALGQLGSAEAAQVLMDLFEQGVTDGQDDAIEFALAGLGCIDSDEGRGYLKEVYELASDPEIRVRLFEGLEESTGDVSEISRLGLLDPDDEVRAAAAWALAYADEPGMDGAEVMGFIAAEADPDVRRYLYQALDGADGVDAAQLMAQMAVESNPDAKLAACQATCRELSMDSDPAAFLDLLKGELIELRSDGALSENQMAIIDGLLEQVGRLEL